MAETLITPQSPVVTGTAPTYEGANVDGNRVDMKTYPRLWLHVKNTNGATRTLTLVTPGTVGGQNIVDRSITIPATTGDLFIPLDRAVKGTDGICHMTWSAVAGVTVAALNVA